MRPAPSQITEPPDQKGLLSMVDVVFLLLIFFIATLHFRVLEGRLESELPKHEGSSTNPVVELLLEPLQLTLVPDATRADGFLVQVGLRDRVDVASLRGRLAQARSSQPDLRTRIRAVDGILHGQVVSVLDACIAAGFTNVEFATS